VRNRPLTRFVLVDVISEEAEMRDVWLQGDQIGRFGHLGNFSTLANLL
jgi:hypothetical protein